MLVMLSFLFVVVLLLSHSASCDSVYDFVGGVFL